MSAGWRDQATCAGEYPELWFAGKDNPEAIATPEWHGVWGGLTPDERGEAIRAVGSRKPRRNARADKRAERAAAKRTQSAKAATKRSRAEELAAAAGLPLPRRRLPAHG